VTPQPQYSRRQLIAIDRPEAKDRPDTFCTRDPHKRLVRIYRRGKDATLHLVTALSIDLDDWPVWHATVGYLQPSGDDADFFVPKRMWTEQMHQDATREMQELARMPYDDPPYRTAWRTKERPAEWHVFWEVTPIVRDMVTAAQSGFYEPHIKISDPRWANEDDV
jgi:hypothetical protein